MSTSSRRAFLADVGRGMLAASVGTAVASELGLGKIEAAADEKNSEKKDVLHFGALEPLVALIQDTQPDKLLPLLTEKLRTGTSLKTLTAAGALANARTFGGHDYIGYHTFMALAPALQMAGELPSERAALPVLKVIFRNAARIQAFGGHDKEILHPVAPAKLPAGANGGELLQAASRAADFDKAETTFATLAAASPGEAFGHLQYAVEDEVDVHRVVLSWRAWATLDITGQEYAHSLLRQSLRYCVNTESMSKSRGRAGSAIRTLLPKLLENHKLLGRAEGDRKADDGWIAKMARLVADASPEQAAEAIAAALAEGFASDDVGEVLCVAANELLLRDPGRPKEWTSDGKGVGSCHGDSVGVHASDAANAWRNIAKVSNQRNRVASLIVGAFHTAGQAGRLNKDFYPNAEQLEKVTAKAPTELLAEIDAALRTQDQFRAMALTHRYGELGHSARPLLDVLIRFGTSSDGALHAEKYYCTATEEFGRVRTPFKWRQLEALARVTASESGRVAAGYDQARELLKVT